MKVSVQKLGGPSQAFRGEFPEQTKSGPEDVFALRIARGYVHTVHRHGGRAVTGALTLQLAVLGSLDDPPDSDRTPTDFFVRLTIGMCYLLMTATVSINLVMLNAVQILLLPLFTNR